MYLFCNGKSVLNSCELAIDALDLRKRVFYFISLVYVLWNHGFPHFLKKIPSIFSLISFTSVVFNELKKYNVTNTLALENQRKNKFCAKFPDFYVEP